MTLRVYHKFLMKVSTDLARENIVSNMELEDDQDQLLQFVGPYYVDVPASGSDQQVIFPPGVSNLRFVALVDVSTSSGLRIHTVAGAGSGEQILCIPPAETDGLGFAINTVNWTSLYLTNPSAAAAVAGKLYMGFADS